MPDTAAEVRSPESDHDTMPSMSFRFLEQPPAFTLIACMYDLSVFVGNRRLKSARQSAHDMPCLLAVVIFELSDNN